MMTTRPRDARRGDAYLAEELAFEGTTLGERPGGPALRAAAQAALTSGWWRAEVGDPALVRRVHVRSAGDSHWAPSTGTLAVDPAESWFVVTHELAHVADCGGGAVHGARWRGWDVVLTAAVFGEAFGRRLARSFADLGLEIEPMSSVPPPEPLWPVVAADRSRRGGWRPAG